MPNMTDALSIRALLQSIEDKLIAGGYDDFVCPTDKGTWEWRAVDRRVKPMRVEPWPAFGVEPASLPSAAIYHVRP